MRAKDLGLTDNSVFFGDWVPYDLRESYLVEADIGVTVARDLAETRLSFRTRVLDYLWSGLPVVTTVSGTNHEIVVPPNERVVDDAEALAAALVGLLGDPARRAAVGAANRRHVETHHELGTQCARMGAAFAEVESR